MTNDEIRSALEKMRSDPRFAELLKEYGETEDRLKVYSEVAGKLGIDLPESELKGYVRKVEEKIKAHTEKEAGAIESIPDNELSAVAGGKDHDNCKDTFKDRENCWFNDGCDIIINSYDGYKCHCNGSDWPCGSYAHCNLGMATD
ncbi:MAG: hypothetical protein IK152_09980 [Lachnospiraceae bacterium]|nr:hypothetical protein [Lachnospiraceae bacterium]